MQNCDNDQRVARIVGTTDLGEDICAAASRLSTRNGTALQTLEKSSGNSNNRKLIDAVLASGHLSVMEHVFFNIVFNNVSVFVEQFLIEFRLASFTVQSRRYVDFSKVGFYSDPTLPIELKIKYREHIKSLFCVYEDLLNMGIPKEDARFVLPYCFNSNFYCTCNARELMHMICSMVYGRGSVFEEIRTLGEQLQGQFEEYFPNQIKIRENDYLAERSAAEQWCKERESTTPNCSPEKVENNVYSIAHTLFNNWGDSTKDEVFAMEDDDRVKQILKSTRARELEFIGVSFRITDISLSAITHYVRHRMQTVIVPCIGDAIYRGRYIIPETIERNQQAKKIYVDSVLANTNVFCELRNKGMSPKLSPYFALSGNSLDIVSSMNGRELIHYFRLRLCNRAQWEIRGVSRKMLKICNDYFPRVFCRVGPSCVMDGICPEGEKSCGMVNVINKNNNTAYME